jgi:hypothetical protein
MSKKIFCCDCKHYIFVRWDKNQYQCFSNPVNNDTPIRPSFACKDCREKNENNDCIEFEPTLWVRIVNYFSRKNDKTETTKPNS